MRKSLITTLLLLLPVTGCRAPRDDAATVVVVIESSPTNLDLRVGTDAQSERVGGLIFDALVKKDDRFQLQPWLATTWEQPDRLTWVFHLRDGVRFHDGHPLQAEDVAWTINSMIDGSLVTAKSGAFASVQHAEARDRLTALVRLKRPDAGLLFNLSDGLFGVVPHAAGKDFGRAPVGSGPFRFVSATQDKEVVLRRSHDYWAGSEATKQQPPGVAAAQPIEQLRFAVVPDAVTTALELRKGSADLASNVMTLDMVHALRNDPGLQTETSPGSPVVYMNFNVTHGPLADRRVRQAIACAMDRAAIVHAVWRDQARLADSLLPVGHWAAPPSGTLAAYRHDVGRAIALLDAAGYIADKNGVRVRLEVKTSTDETTRLMAVILQQQLRDAGIQLTIRPAEFGTFYADVTHGVFEIYMLRWIGSNEDPDIFRYAYATESFPPKGGNRGRYSNPRVDDLLTAAVAEPQQAARMADYIEVQQILAKDLPGIPMWYPNNQVVHTRRLTDVVPRASGSFDFLRDAKLSIR